jgi:hypothetical protein
MIVRSRLLLVGIAIVVAIAVIAVIVVVSNRPSGGPAPTAAPPDDGAGLRITAFLGEQRIAPDTTLAGTTFGGISGIDRDGDTWFLVSDDRSAKQPARFYTAGLTFGGPDGALSGVEITGSHPFLRPDGAPYPALAGGDGTTVDPEDMRVDPRSKQLVWSQEGERVLPADGKPAVLIDPTVRIAERDGRFVRELPVLDDLKPTIEDRGIRQNNGPEGLTFSADGEQILLAVEDPLLQDGPLPTRTSGAVTRIVVLSRDGQVRAQHAYPLEPLFADPTAKGAATTGITAILAEPDSPSRYLVLERSFAPGVGNKVGLYEVDLAGAADIGTGPIAAAAPVTKHLVADVAGLPVQSVDNIEGMAWGPDRPDGSRTLVLVSDDNFSPEQVTQFVAVAVRPI